MTDSQKQIKTAEGIPDRREIGSIGSVTPLLQEQSQS